VQPTPAGSWSGPVRRSATRPRRRSRQPHELLILRNVPLDAIPADEAGGLDEAKLPSGSIVGRIGPFPARSTCDGVFALTSGTYLLMDDITVLKPIGAVVSNAATGMVSQITVR
jgi:hypothetical protein